MVLLIFKSDVIMLNRPPSRQQEAEFMGFPGCELPLLTFTCPGAKSMNNKQVCNFRSGKRNTGPFSFYQWITNMANRSNDDLFSFILVLPYHFTIG